MLTSNPLYFEQMKVAEIVWHLFAVIALTDCTGYVVGFKNEMSWKNYFGVFKVVLNLGIVTLISFTLIDFTDFSPIVSFVVGILFFYVSRFVLDFALLFVWKIANRMVQVQTSMELSEEGFFFIYQLMLLLMCLLMVMGDTYYYQYPVEGLTVILLALCVSVGYSHICFCDFCQRASRENKEDRDNSSGIDNTSSDVNRSIDQQRRSDEN